MTFLLVIGHIILDLGILAVALLASKWSGNWHWMWLSLLILLTGPWSYRRTR